MEKYHKEPPYLLPHPNHPHLPPCTVLVIAVFGSRVTHICVLSERRSEPWHGFSSPSQAGASRCAQHGTLHIALFSKTSGRQTGGKDRATTFTCQHVSCLDDIGGPVTRARWGVQVQQERGLGSLPRQHLPEQFAHGDNSRGFCWVWLTGRPHYMDFLASCHL